MILNSAQRSNRALKPESRKNKRGRMKCWTCIMKERVLRVFTLRKEKSLYNRDLKIILDYCAIMKAGRLEFDRINLFKTYFDHN